MDGGVHGAQKECTPGCRPAGAPAAAAALGQPTAGAAPTFKCWFQAHLLKHALIPFLLLSVIHARRPSPALLLRLRVHERRLLPPGAGCKRRNPPPTRLLLLLLLLLLERAAAAALLEIHPGVAAALGAVPQVAQRGLPLLPLLVLPPTLLLLLLLCRRQRVVVECHMHTAGWRRRVA